jgi:hypothetical protein
VRFRAFIVRPPLPAGTRQPVSCRLHHAAMCAQVLIRSVFSLVTGLLTAVG